MTLLGILLLAAGFVFVGIELLLPGFSIPGTLGVISLVAGVLLLADTVMEGLMITVIVLALLGILMAVILLLFSKGRIKSPIVLQEEQKKTQGYLSSSDLNYLLGKQGVVKTDLRPTGVVQIDGVNFDVLSEGNYISAGEHVTIIKVEGSKLIVRNG